MRGLRFATIASFLMWLAQPVAARGGMPEPLTERGQVIESIYFQIFVAGTIVFLFVMALLVYVMWKYRAGSGEGKATFEHERHSLKLEMVWIIIPLFIVLWVGFISYAGLVQLDSAADAENADMEIHITGQKWFWSATYGEGDFTVNAFYDTLGNVNDGNEFYVPAGKNILLNVTGADVIHSFYIADSNWAPVGMIDANPTGPHKFNRMVINLPAGEYQVQCKEMCFNPGHGYMRAKIISVPQADYDAWYDSKLAGAAAGLTAVYAAELTPGGFDVEGIDRTAKGATVQFQVANGRAQDVTFTVTGADGAALTIPAGETAILRFTASDEGTVTLSSDQGDSYSINVVEAQVVKVELGDFFIRPSDFTLQAGGVYIIEVENTGGIPHNLYIGSYNSASDKSTVWASPDINGGDSASFLVIPDTAMSFQTWCDVPGHAGAGMLASMRVA